MFEYDEYLSIMQYLFNIAPIHDGCTRNEVVADCLCSSITALCLLLFFIVRANHSESFVVLNKNNDNQQAMEQFQ